MTCKVCIYYCTFVFHDGFDMISKWIKITRIKGYRLLCTIRYFKIALFRSQKYYLNSMCFIQQQGYARNPQVHFVFEVLLLRTVPLMEYQEITYVALHNVCLIVGNLANRISNVLRLWQWGVFYLCDAYFGPSLNFYRLYQITIQD